MTVGWYHRLNGHEFKQTPGDGEEQRSLACCSPWGQKERHALVAEEDSHLAAEEEAPSVAEAAEAVSVNKNNLLSYTYNEVSI